MIRVVDNNMPGHNLSIDDEKPYLVNGMIVEDELSMKDKIQNPFPDHSNK